MMAISIIMCVLCVASAGVSNGIDQTDSMLLETVSTKSEPSCGPSCVLAIIRLTDKGSNKYTTVEDVYDLIGKSINTPTTLYDLKIAAKELGFNAEGYKCTVEHLIRINGYAILTIGQSKGTATDPLHMILLKEIRDNMAIIIDPNTLHDKYINVSELEKLWNGYVLMISPEKDVPLFRIPTNENKSVIQETIEDTDEIKNFGIVDGGSLLEHSFPIRNETDAPVTLRIVGKNCACVSAELGKAKLSPEQETFLKINLHISEPGESVATVAVEMLPAKLIKRYSVKAQGRDSFQTKPTIGYIEVPNAGGVEYPVTVMYFTDLNDIVTLDHVDVNFPNLEIKDIKIEKVLLREQYLGYYVNTKLFYDGDESTDTVSKVQGKLDFVLNTTRGKRFIPFKLTVKIGSPKYTLTPEKVFIITSKADNKIEKKIKLEFLSDQVPENITVNSDASVPYEVTTTREDEKSFMINLSSGKERLQNIELGMHKSELVIVPEGVFEFPPIKLPVSMFVRE